MKDETGEVEFESGRVNLQLALRGFWIEGELDGGTYWRLLRRAWRAKATEELLEIARELARIVKGGSM